MHKDDHDMWSEEEWADWAKDIANEHEYDFNGSRPEG